MNCFKLNEYFLFDNINSVFSERYANIGDNSMRIIYLIYLPIIYQIKILIRNVIPHSIPKVIDFVIVEKFESLIVESLDIERKQFNSCLEIS
jgi:hypothetical protein